PVVPLVYPSIATSTGVTVDAKLVAQALNSSKRLALTADGRSAGPFTTMSRFTDGSAGNWASSAERYFASKITARVPEFSRMYRRMAPLNAVFKDTSTAPRRLMPNQETMYSGQLSSMIATRSPLLIPRPARPLATCADFLSMSANEISDVSNFRKVRSPKRCADNSICAPMWSVSLTRIQLVCSSESWVGVVMTWPQVG